MATVVQYKLWLEDAELKLQQLMTGRLPKVIVDQNGERVEYSSATVGQLQKYIAWLNFMIANNGQTTISGPMNVWM